MTSTLERPGVFTEPPPPRPRRRRPPGPAGLRRWTSEHRSVLWLAPLLVVGAIVHAIGMNRAPQRIDDEGTYVAQAYAVQYFGELAHYTFWYDHPPMGWLQIAAWTWVTDAFDRVTPAVAAGREFMLVAHLAASVLVWLLARRMGLARPGAALAVLVYVLSPLAVAYHRQVYLDNIAMPWLLAAFVLASTRRHQLAAFSASAACFVLAVLTKETFLLLMPPYLWWIWQHAHAATRRYTLTVAGSLLTVLGLGYVVFAVLKGELLSGDTHVSLMDGIRFQLFERASSGSVLDRESQAGDTVDLWMAFDAVLPVVATVCAIAILFVKRLRPIAATYLLLLAFMLRPGYLPVPYVVAMIPFAALLVAAAVEVGVRRGGAVRAGTVAAAVTAAALAVPVWGQGLGMLMNEDLDRPMAQATEWLLENSDGEDRMLVDDAVWVDLLRSGLPRDQVVWYYKADTDPEVMEETPRGWRDYDYLLLTESVRRSLEIQQELPGGGPYPVVQKAFRNSVVKAEYGEGNQRVEIREVVKNHHSAENENVDALAAQ